MITATTAEQTTTTTSKGEKKKKIQEKRRHVAHTLWLAADPWELQRRRTTQRRWPEMEPDLKKTKRSSRLWWSVNHSETPPMTENNETLKRPVFFPSLQCLQQRQCVSDAHDVKRTTVRARWWRTVYWSGSLCLCKRFDIHATSPPSRWEGKLLFLASLAARRACVYFGALTRNARRETRARSAQGVHV